MSTNQPSAPSMSIEEARESIKDFQEIFDALSKEKESNEYLDCRVYSLREINNLIIASSLLAASEQRARDAKIVNNIDIGSAKEKPLFWLKGRMSMQTEASEQILNQDNASRNF